MKYRFILLCVAFLAVLHTADAQQEHHYTQFMYNKLLINPGYAGARQVPSATALYRNQWVGFDGAPKSFLASINTSVLSPRVGVGLVLSHNQIGLSRDFSGAFSYSYDLVGDDDVSVRAGIMGSVRSIGYDFTQANAIDQVGDPSFENKRINDFTANVGAGMYATINNMVYIGISIPRIYSNIIGLNKDAKSITAREYRHYYIMAGAVLPVTDDLNILPAILVKYVENTPWDADLNMNLDIKEKFTIGLSYRVGGDGSGESVSVLALYQATEQLAIGGAYDFTLSKIRDYTAGTFELLVQADLKKKQRLQRLSNPRFFM